MKIALSIIALVAVFATIIFLVVNNTNLRNFNMTSKGQRGLSANIKESKARGVFLTEYVPLSNPTVVNDSIKLHIEEAWIERNWYHTSFTNETIADKDMSSRLLIRLKPESVVGVNETWTIGLDTKNYLYSTGDSTLLSNDLEATTHPDSIQYAIQQGTRLKNNNSPTILGELILMRKLLQK